MGTVIVYVKGARSASEIKTMIDEELAKIGQDGDMADAVSQYGAEPSTLARDGAANVSQRDAGFDVTELIIDLLGPMTYDIWKYVILPRIMRRHGADVLGEEQDGDTTLR
ncbi:hypothetical protein AB0D62_38570 [Streptomyces massasporeus]|uniref:hypothetical protein n=1 Tax=Streptomyces massasporeus TaxID=67324 RepID=UPI0033EE3217